MDERQLSIAKAAVARATGDTAGGGDSSSVFSRPVLIGVGVAAVLGVGYLAYSLLTSKDSRRLQLKKAINLFESAKVRRDNEDWERAISEFEESLALLRAYLPQTDENIAKCLVELGTCYLTVGAGGHAFNCAQEALVVRQHNHGQDSIETVDDLLSVSSVCLFQKRFQIVEANIGLAMEILNAQPEPDNLRLSAALALQASIHLLRQDFETAESLAHQSIEKAKAVNPEDVEPTLRYRRNLEGYLILGQVYAGQGNYDKQEQAIKDAVQMTRQELGDDLDAALQVRNLGEFYESQGDFVKAEECMKESIDMIKRRYGSNNETVSRFIIHAAHFYWDHGRDEEAENMFEELRHYTCPPSPATSCLLGTKMATITFSNAPGGAMQPMYLCEYIPINKIPRGSRIEFEFEDPKSDIAVIDQREITSDDDEVLVHLSPNITGFKPQTNYEIIARIYDRSGAKLCEHHQLVRCIIDTDLVHTQEDLFRQMPKDVQDMMRQQQ
eukprot:TRINITY_DN1213_c0_g1_i1.p1 TRINITY_DN1213_c0_g1~~TRINITY_DN1213_c0_g1_i1.p1  ORF type:complete len:498 (-),score=98.38 TRINITY_DN1213_c0_g1_i1:53-1546(-)